MRWLLPILALALPTLLPAQSIPIEAALPQPLSADHLEPGAGFVLRVVAPWDRNGCHLATGTLLRATVRSVKRDGNHASELTFVLTAPCGDRGPLPVIVASLIAPPVITAANQPTPSFFGQLNGKAGAPPPISRAFIDESIVSSETRGERNSRDTGPIIVHVNKLPKTIAAGDVIHLNHIRLTLPPAGGEVSTIGTSGTSLHLPEYTIFILRAAADPALSSATSVAAVPAPALPTVARHAIEPFISACRPDRCTMFPASTGAATFGVSPLRPGQDLVPLGFRPDHDRDVPDLSPAATVHFLGENDLLVTFPTHDLIRRTGTERPSDDPTSVRALLFNAATGLLEHSEPWIIDDRKPYIWAVGSNLLIHDGPQLRLLGPGFQTLATLPLSLPLDTVQPSPDGEHVLLGEVHELHTMEDHRLLRQTNARPQEEEIVWSLLDSHLRRVRSLGVTSSYVPPPTLRNDGLLELRRGQPSEWFLAFQGWDFAGEKLVGKLHSSCLPTMGNLSPDLLTIATCDALGGGSHTYVLSASGAPILEQTSTSEDLPLSFASSGTAPRIALLLTRADERYVRGLAFNQSSLQSQTVKVLGTRHTALLASVALPEVTPYTSAFAISPNGKTLALLSGHTLLLYALPPEPSE